MRPDICIYHDPCADGFTAAWAIWNRWPDVAFVPAKYGDAPPDVAGKHVLIVDFSYKRDVLLEMGRSAASITILDHHKTAEADLAPFAASTIDALYGDPQDFADLCQFQGQVPIRAYFDMDRSGAMLAWNFAHPGVPAPRLVEHVQDRDLWRFDLPGTRAIQATVFSHRYDFAIWDRLASLCEDAEGRLTLIAEGEAIERKHFKDVDELLVQMQRHMIIGGHRVPVANLPYTMASDGAGKLAAGNPFAATYFDRADGKRVFSLRSDVEGLDVAAIAASYGGGGHARAAGFTAAQGWEGDPA